MYLQENMKVGKMTWIQSLLFHVTQRIFLTSVNCTVKGECGPVRC